MLLKLVYVFVNAVFECLESVGYLNEYGLLELSGIFDYCED